MALSAHGEKFVRAFPLAGVGAWVLGAIHNLADTTYLFIGFRKSTPPEKRQLGDGPCWRRGRSSGPLHSARPRLVKALGFRV